MNALGRHLALVGFMGAGKTTVGREVAERLGRPFFDADEEIERRTGTTIAELFQDGEERFRRVEEESPFRGRKRVEAGSSLMFITSRNFSQHRELISLPTRQRNNRDPPNPRRVRPASPGLPRGRALRGSRSRRGAH